MIVKVTSYRILVAVICLAIVSPSLFGQEEREYIRKGNKLYKKNEFAGSEGMYRRAQEGDKSSGDAVFNLGNSLYKQKRFGEASGEFIRSAQAAEGDSLKQAEGFYNLGNSLLKEQKFGESIDAYINSLKLNPGNVLAKYNLAYAQDQLKQQQQQQQDDDKKQKPSEFAKRLKAQADKLVTEGRFTDAWELMQDGLKKDQTVGYYNDFIQKTGKVSKIEKTVN